MAILLKKQQQRKPRNFQVRLTYMKHEDNQASENRSEADTGYSTILAGASAIQKVVL